MNRCTLFRFSVILTVITLHTFLTIVCSFTINSTKRITRSQKSILYELSPTLLQSVDVTTIALASTFSFGIIKFLSYSKFQYYTGVH